MTIFIPLLETYIQHYQKSEQGFIDMIGSTVVPKKVITALYEMFVHRKEIEPIETISKEERQRIWNKAREYEGTQDDRIMISYSIYLLESITK
jgi:hypothetical protein